MGVPKFFRYISERYPCLSEVVKEHQIPEFDHLYLDMNGIIHVCSHPNDNDPHFRISEENIFNDIFHYIEILFRMIQPKRLFFMAIDGVAPRAKMNQQRGRRFRTAKDMELQEAKARLNNEVLPSAERFDSNCITPGTVFMARLHAQLRYLVNYKISTDKLWQKPTIILSGHETPGEGEHKIMDYIRFMKSQPDYDPNTRHCLYGLDADLIMLGLCTHEPHFSLLREEVKFGRSTKDKKRASVPEEIRFYLLHLSLMREYIDLEFQELKTTLKFSYNLENIIDDWVLMGFLVGNDFIPHLPNLHIANGALPVLYRAYMDVLPTLGGYINERGKLNLSRFQKYMEVLAKFDFEQFKDAYADLKYFLGKTGRRPNEKERTSYKNTNIADELIEKIEETTPVKNPELEALIQSTNKIMTDDDIYYSSTDEDDQMADMCAEFYQHKNDYYCNKLEYEVVTQEVLKSQADGYVRAIQWNLNYYYNGCCSWSWFYPHHYAPFISDITNFEDLELEFDVGEPFLPFQQLLAVLPAASKKLLPEPFQELMVNGDSPIIDFYPVDFKTDLNGKRQEWEAVVLIPFINQEALLDAMATKYDRLTDEEKRRNSHGPMLVYNYTAKNQGVYEAPEYYPTLNKCFAKEVPLYREEIFVEQSKLVKGLCPGVRLDVYFPGFPTMKHLEFTASLKKAKVKVFDTPSRGENMVVQLKENHEYKDDLSEVALKILDTTVFINWPHLMEAKVVAVASESKRVTLKQCTDGTNTLVIEDLNQDFVQQWKLSKKGIEEMYYSKMGVQINNTEIVVYARNLEGRKYVFTNTGRVSYEKKWAKFPSMYAFQTLVQNIAAKEPDYTEHLTIDDLFKPSTICFTLGTPHYGAMGTVCEGGRNGRIKLSVCITSEPDLEPAIITAQHCRSSYIPGHVMAQRLGISSHLLSRITGSIFVVDTEPGSSTESLQRTNVGLNLKFTKKNEQVCGYTRKENGQWLYSSKAEQLINDYMRMASDVVSYIAANACNDIFCVKELFVENGIEGLKKLSAWLNEQDFMKAERLSCGSEILEEEVVSVIERIIDYTKNKTAKTVVMQIKPHLLLLPMTSVTGLSPDANATHKLFDRIICTRESFTVPLGLKGTITGIQNAEKEDDVIYDAVFDMDFVGGIQIRCSQNRGYRMTRKGFLNLSHGVRLENSKAKNNGSVQQSCNDHNRFDSVPWNNRRNSAFASCSSKKGGNQQYNRQQEIPSVQQFQKSNNFMPKFAANQRKGNTHNEGGGTNEADSNKPASSEFQAMWDELKKAGTKIPSNIEVDQDKPASADASDVLKKMLKIANNTSPKRKFSSNCHSLPSCREENKDAGRQDKDIVSNQDESSVKQLANYLKQYEAEDPVYSYEYGVDVNGKSLVTAKIYFELPPEEEKTFSGRPSQDIKSAAESAALTALNSIKLESVFNVKSDEERDSKTSTVCDSSRSGCSGNYDADCARASSGVRRPVHPPNAYSMQNPAGATGMSAPVVGYNSSGARPQSKHYHRYQQQVRNNGGGNAGSHNMKSNFNWYNPDLPPPPQQWYQNSMPAHQNNSGRHIDWKQRQDQRGNDGDKQQYQQQHYGGAGSGLNQHQLPHMPYHNFPPYQKQPYSNLVGQNSNVPNWKQIRPFPQMVSQTPFIPLQAITQCRAKPSSCSNFISKNTTESYQSQQVSSLKTVVDGSNSNSNQLPMDNHSRPPTVLSQPRRSRIAANFNLKIE